MSNLTGTIFDIQGFSVHDGPGCRTLVFMKGCSLKCKWCSNPEGIKPFPIPMYNKSKCILDGTCVKACPKNAITIKNNSINIDRDKCISCSKKECAEKCITGAIKIAGYKISIEELFKKIQRDRQYWGEEGGITLTGGEPFSQDKFTFEILKKCYENYIHTAIETCGNIPWSVYSKSIKYIDWIFFDIKHINKQKHIEQTGIDNSLILDNISKLAKYFKERLIFRTVIIPDFNDSEKDITELGLFLQKLPRDKKEINILSLHHLAKEKYNMLGEKYFSDNLDIPTKNKLDQIKDIFNSFDIECYINSDTPF